MNTKIKNLIRGIILVLVLALVFQICTQLLENKSAQVKYRDFFDGKTNFDVIFLGTSHTQNTVLPMEIWRETGISSYNWGQSNCTTAVNYYLIQDIVKYTNPKLVVLDLYGLMGYEGYGGNGKYRTDRLGQQRVQFDELPFSLNKIKAARDVFDDYSNNMDMVINLLTYHNRWKELNESDFVVNPSLQKGAELLTGVGASVQYVPIGDEKIELNSACYDYLLRFLDYCENKNIQVLCVFLPYPAKEHEQRQANSVGEIIDTYENADYLNMLDIGVVNYSVDMYLDGSHLNYNGAVKVSKWLGKYIADNYQMDDYCQDQNWISDWEDYTNYKYDRICNMPELYDKLSLLQGDDLEVKLTVRKGANIANQDCNIVNIIEDLNGSISQVDALTYGEQQCDVLIEIYKRNTSDKIDAMGYTYSDNAFIPVEII